MWFVILVVFLVVIWKFRKTLRSVTKSTEEYGILIEKEAKIDLRKRGHKLQQKASTVKDYPLPSEVDV